MRQLFFILLILPGLIVRFLWLDQVPPGLYHDEMDAVMIARYYLQHGTDPLGTPFPVSMVKNQVETGDDTLLSLLLTPFSLFLPASVLTARLPMVFINLLTCLTFSLFVYRRTKNTLLTAAFAFLMIYSPWSLILSRSLTQAPLSLLFISLGLSVSPVLSGIFLSLAFLAYYGTRPLVLALVLIYPLITRTNVRRILPLWIVFGLFITLYMGFALTVPGSTWQRRTSEVKITDLSRFASIVDDQRRMALTSPWASLFTNKLTAQFKESLGRYFSYLSPDFLFVSGDPSAAHRLTYHGLAYWPDLVFFLAGIGPALTAPLGSTALILAALSPLGTLLNTSGHSNMYRGTLFLPMFLIISVFGWYSLKARSRLTAALAWLAIPVYLILAANFYYYYFFQFPVTNGERTFLSERILAGYLNRISGPVEVVAGQPVQIAQQVIFFSPPRLASLPILSRSGPFQLSNIAVSSACPPNFPSHPLVIQAAIKCPVEVGHTPLVIQDQKDTGTLWKIYSDTICMTKDLAYWERFHPREAYSPEGLTTASFCQNWINKFPSL